MKIPKEVSEALEGMGGYLGLDSVIIKAEGLTWLAIGNTYGNAVFMIDGATITRMPNPE